MYGLPAAKDADIGIMVNLIKVKRLLYEIIAVYNVESGRHVICPESQQRPHIP